MVLFVNKLNLAWHRGDLASLARGNLDLTTREVDNRKDRRHTLIKS